MIVTVFPALVGPEVGDREETTGTAAVHVNTSLAEVADLLPPWVVTTVSPLVPPGSAGTLTLRLVGDWLTTVAPNCPTVTEVGQNRLLPLMTTEVGPSDVPEGGWIEVTTGAPAVYWYVTDPEVPPLVLTVTPYEFWQFGGTVTTICPSVNEVIVAAADPKWTQFGKFRCVPVMVTVVPPLVLPPVELREEIVGGCAVQLKRSLLFVGEVPRGVVTVTSTMVPPGSAGTLTLSRVGVFGSEGSLMIVACVTEPKLTTDGLQRSVPLISRVVVPPLSPVAVERPVTVGGAPLYAY